MSGPSRASTTALVLAYHRHRMSILNNAILAIQVGLEDMEQGSQGRLLSAVRNLTAGVLLLLKHRLWELSPQGSDEVLLKVKIKPQLDSSGQLGWKGTGKKTVDVQEIEDRLTGLGVTVDWKRVTRLTNERNNVEHYYTKMSEKALSGIMTDVLVIIRDFTARELKRDPAELLGDTAWKKLLANAEVYDSERNGCLEELRKVKWESLALAAAIEDYACSSCGSQLVRPCNLPAPVCELDLECRSCGEFIGPPDFLDALRSSSSSVDSCPGCDLSAFVLQEDRCAYCGHEPEHTECYKCGTDLDLEEQELGGLCGGCHHFATKDD